MTLAAPLLLAATCGGAATARAEAVVIDFEAFPGMIYLSGNPIPESARLADQLASSLGVVFSSGAPYVAVVELGAGHATSGINAIGGSTPGGILTYDRQWPLVFQFVDPQSPAMPAATDFVSVRLDLWASSGLEVDLNAYDVNGVLIASAQSFDIAGAMMSVDGPGIHRVEFLGTHDNDGVGLDDLTFNPVVALPTAVQSCTWGGVKAQYP
jgi:hypothetical protein